MKKMKSLLSKRKSEMWVSNNRVLVGGIKKVTGRNPNFDTDETRLLISLWGDPKIQKTLITTHKKHAVIARLAEKMREYGYHRSAEEINTRIKNLKCFYNRIKKDLECGVQVEPTWKHYQSMDEIMTRPIFSVRPNEIPKPSLKYRLEEEKRAREERGETTINNGEDDKVSIGDDEEMINSVAGNECAIKSANNENFSSKSPEVDSNNDESAMDFEEEKPDIKELEKTIKEPPINKKINTVLQEPAPVIKNEPIDIDDEDDDNMPNKNDHMNSVKTKTGDDSFLPSLHFLKSSFTENSPKSNIITTIATSVNNNKDTFVNTSTALKQLVQPTIMLSTSTASCSTATKSVTSSNSTQAKISLVPTNFLLKPTGNTQNQQLRHQLQVQKPVQIPAKIAPKPQSQPQQQTQSHRIIYTQNTNQQQNLQNNIVNMNTNNGPMKVLLVQNMPKNQQNNTNMSIQNIPDIQTKTIYNASTVSQQPSTTIFPKSITSQSSNVNLGNMVSSSNVEKINLISSRTPSKNPTGYRALLGQLIKTQAENNEIQRQRLRIERQRLEFEKSVAEKFFMLVPELISNLTNGVQQKAPVSEKNKSNLEERRNSREKSKSLDDNAIVSIPIKIEKDTDE